MIVAARVVATQPLVTSGSSASDLDGDGPVGIGDLQRFAAAWDTLQGQPGYSRTLDLNDSGLVDLPDLTMAGEGWNSLC